MNAAVLKTCEDDNDCLPTYTYCYKISKRCVNFTICARYNRAEGETPARNGAQCGPCMRGYATELLTDGTEKSLCQRNITDENHNLGSSLNETKTIWIIMGISFLILIATLCCFIRKCRVFRKWYNNFCNKNCFVRNELNTDANTDGHVSNAAININASMIATAPPEEQSLLIELVEEKRCVPPINNEQATDTNMYQTSRPFRSPMWVRNANDNTNQLHFDNVDAPNERNIIVQIVNNIPNNDQPARQLTINGPSEVNMEQQDNARNTALLQTSSIQNADSDTDSSSELNENNNDNSKNVTINQSINQNITMKVNFQ